MKGIVMSDPLNGESDAAQPTVVTTSTGPAGREIAMFSPRANVAFAGLDAMRSLISFLRRRLRDIGSIRNH
jgi:hypothetical protein